MIQTCIRHSLVAAMLFAVACAGCQKKSQDTAVPTAPAPTAQSTPEESFEYIVETFKRGVEDVPIGFVIHDESGSQTMMTGRNEVSHEIIPPAKGGEPYKAVITVKSRSQYSLQRTEKPKGPEEQDQSNGENSGDAVDDTSGVEVFDPSIASADGTGVKDRRPTTPKPDKDAVTVAREDNEHERKYELVYENGRWKLITKLDDRTEKSIQLAFDRALESQS
jgi:hypothetical protein